MENTKDFLNNKPDGFLIAGVGASAGGVQALREFFQHVPADSGIAYVVILHLSPDHDSQLAHVLQLTTSVPIEQVTEKVKIKPNHVYVVPPNQHLVMQDECIIPLVNMSIEDRRAPVDIFFRHLADTYGPRAVAVVLSGTGANGSMGLKRVKELGGVAFVQNPREAEFNEMPRNSIATELVDEVLPVADIPAAIVRYSNNIHSVEIAVETENRPEQQQQALREIFAQLRFRTGHDFANYKRPTLLRRIERRISIHNLPDLPAYSELMQKNPDEARALLKDLLISVTNFFRDKKAFDLIESDVIPVILDGKKSTEQVRVWIVGCATGEEAYSLAILFAERTQGIVDAPSVQIFATDIDETAIATAREGLYTLNDAADVSPERLARFFKKEGDGYRVRREIRETVLFANHNMLKDPPFSRLDMVACRNVLIYLNQGGQERIMETFHFALKPRGFLFLGTSELPSGAGDLYAVFNRDCHIFQAREVTSKHYPLPESTPIIRPRQDLRAVSTENEHRYSPRTSYGELHQKLLEQYAPPSVVVNENYEILHMSERVGKYFEFAAGEPTQDLLKLVRPEIRLALRIALHEAVQKQAFVDTRPIKLIVDGREQLLNLHIRPVLDKSSTSKGFILVIFEPGEEVPEMVPVIISFDDPITQRLEEELARANEQLRNSNEEHEFQAEELKAANEELQALNEELRSSAEELETSKEELQSINEELRTVNQELKVKIDEISSTSNNLQNLINSADLGTIFLDRSLRTRMFTPAARDIFNLIPSDLGRALSDITNNLEYRNLQHDAETVLEKLVPIQREVRTTENRYYIMQVLPYRTAEDRINGVVLTFFEVTGRKHAEQALQQSEERLRLLIESATDYAIFSQDPDRHIISWSSGAQRMIGYSEDELIGKIGDIIFTPEDRANGAPEKEAETARKEERARNERWHVRKDGSRFWGSGSVSTLRDSDGKLLGFVKIMRDLTETKEAEEQYAKAVEALRMSESRFRTLSDAVPQVIWTNDAAGYANYFNKRWYEYTGLTYDECKGLGWQVIVHPLDAKASVEKWKKALADGDIFDVEYRLRNHSGQYCWFIGRNVPLKDDAGKVISWFGSATDIDALKNAEEALRNTADRLQLALEAGKLGTYEYDFQTNVYVCSGQHKANFGYTESDPINLEDIQNRVVPADRTNAQLLFDKTKEKDAVYSTEYRVQVPDGDTRWIRSVGRFVYDKNDEPQKMVGITLDITDEKMFTEELSKQVKERTIQLQEFNNDLQQFAHIASHDLKEPVRKIKTFYNRIIDNFNGTLPEQVVIYLDKINSSTDRMISMIEGVLNYSKAGNSKEALKPVDLNKIIESIRLDLEVLIANKKAGITTTGLTTITGNETLIYQLFYNLLLNSLKFAKTDVPATINISCTNVTEDQKNFVKIILSDNGIGFDQEYAEEIFGAFARLNTQDEYEGTGLGLALCKKIVERHGGSIYAHGELGKGAAFTILLPLTQTVKHP